MPKIFIHSPEGTFSAASRRKVAAEITDFALNSEGLPASPYMKSNVWIYFREYAQDEVFLGERPATLSVISVQFYAIEGGLDERSRPELIKGVTQILGRNAGLAGRLPVFVALHELPERNWGSFGANPSLAAMRSSPPDAAPL